MVSSRGRRERGNERAREVSIFQPPLAAQKSRWRTGVELFLVLASRLRVPPSTPSLPPLRSVLAPPPWAKCNLKSCYFSFPAVPFVSARAPQVRNRRPPRLGNHPRLGFKSLLPSLPRLLLIALLKKRKLGHFRPGTGLSWQTFVRVVVARSRWTGAGRAAACNCRANNQRPRGGTIST